MIYYCGKSKREGGTYLVQAGEKVISDLRETGNQSTSYIQYSDPIVPSGAKLNILLQMVQFILKLGKSKS